MKSTLDQQRQELAHVRRLNASAEPRFVPKPIAHQKQTVFLRDGVLLDPNRKVSAFWSVTAYCGVSRMIARINTLQGQVLDAGDGPGISNDSGGPFRLRVLASMGSRPGIGSVIEVSAVEYVLLRAEQLEAEATPGGRPRFEPVPNDVSVRGALLPSNFPTHLPKARALAAKGLDKLDLTFAEIVKFFEKAKPVVETFG